MGTCGQCAVLFHGNSPRPSKKDCSCFTPRQLAQGLRLGCSHYPEPDQSLEIVSKQQQACFAWAGQEAPLCLGIDIGTTSVKWGFEHHKGLISQGLAINPQMGAGPDIMSRLSFAGENSANFMLLGRLLREELDSILDLSRVPEGRICVTGNPAMLHFLLGRDIAGLSVSPYSLDYSGGVSEYLGQRQVRAFIPSLWSPFVGADISAGLCWLLQEIKPAYPFLFADFGTNGELVLALSPDKYLTASVALGPALEGVGLRFGSPDREGVASGFVLSSRGIEPSGPWHGGKVSGSGYISLLAHLIRLKLISVSGLFSDQGLSPIARRISSNFKDGRLSIGGFFYLDGRDIESFLKVKAAFTLGLSFLCAQGGLSPDKLKAIHIAGALGQHSNLSDLETLGFFPPGSSQKSLVVGNTSLKGAVLLARDNNQRQVNINLARLVESINLGAQQEYLLSRFARHMTFEYPG